MPINDKKNIVLNLNKKFKMNLFIDAGNYPSPGAKIFREICELLLSSKVSAVVNRILLVQDGNILPYYKDVATNFNTYFKYKQMN